MAAKKTPHLKRVFTGLTLDTNDVRTIARLAERAGPIEVRANSARLMDVDQVDQVIAEDVVLDRLVITASAPEGTLEFVYEQSYVLARADDDAPALREPFAAIVALLEAKPRNAFGRCSMDVSQAGSWREPAPVASLPTPAAPPAQRATRVPSAAGQTGALKRWWQNLPFNRQRADRQRSGDRRR